MITSTDTACRTYPVIVLTASRVRVSGVLAGLEFSLRPVERLVAWPNAARRTAIQEGTAASIGVAGKIAGRITSPRPQARPLWRRAGSDVRQAADVAVPNTLRPRP